MTLSKAGVAVGDYRSAIAMARYVLDPADSPAAFARPGDAPAGVEPSPLAMWLGSSEALDRIGLTRGAAVDAEDLVSALWGRHTKTGAQVRRPGSAPMVDRFGQPLLNAKGEPYREARVNNFRPVLSAPKTVAEAWAQAHAALRAQIERAMMNAANAAIDHIVRTRNVVSGKERGHGFAAAITLHVTGRTARGQVVPDPQLHVHIDLVGVLDSKGDLRTPNSAALYKHHAMREAGAVGRAWLAMELERIGFQIEARTGRGGRYFEIVGVPKELCERHSGRSRDVEAWVAERVAAVGAVSRKEAASGALRTRTSKHAGVLSPAEIQQRWDDDAGEFRFGPTRIAELLAAPAVRRDLDELRGLARTEILQRIWAEGPAISIGALRSMAFELAPIGLSLTQAGELLAQMQAEGELIALDGWRVTSREIRESELRVRTVAEQAAQTQSGPLSAVAIAQGIAVAERRLDGHALDGEQVDAVGVLSSGAGWACLTGPAGTGKGPVLEAVAAAHEFAGWRVIACAVDGATAVRLGAQIGSSAMTLEQLFHRLDDLRIDERTLIVIDEASKVGLRDWTRLAALVEETQARMLPAGDVGQLGAIESPGMLDVMLAADSGIPVARLETVRRHRDPTDPINKTHPWLIDYQRLLYRGDAAGAIKILRDRRAITMHRTRDEAMISMVEKWADRRREEELAARDTVLIVHGSNEDVDRVNALAQAVRIGAGELKGEGVPAVDRDYRLHAGDVVMLREAAYQPPRTPGSAAPRRVENGTMGVVERVDVESGRVWVAFERPEGGTRSVMVDHRQLRERRAQRRSSDERVAALRLAYAGHPFPMQGATFKYVGSLWGRAPNKLDVYSGDTRAKLWLDVHVDRESAGSQGTDDDRYRRLARSLKASSHRLASISYAEAPHVQVAAAISEHERVPDVWAPRTMTAIPDVLERYRSVLGDQRLEWIADRVGESAEKMAELTGEELQEACLRGEQAFAQLDRAAAAQALSIEEGQRRAEPFERRYARLVEQELELVSQRRHPSQWLDSHGLEFARGIAAARRLELQPETPAVRIRREDVVVADPLDRYRDVLGRVRVERISRRAGELFAQLPDGRDVRLLRAERDAAAAAFTKLNRAGARKTLRFEHERMVLEERVRTARPEEAALVRGDLARIARLTVADRDLRERGHHLDTWMERHWETAARWAAIERELAIRREVEIANQVERSLLNPSAHLRERIGESPAPTAPERAEWEALARELERDRASADVHRREGLEAPARDAASQRRLERRIEKLAAERNLPPGPDRGQGRDPPALGR